MPVDWLQLGVAGGALAAMLMMVRALMRHQEKQQTEVLTFFANHMSAVVDTQERVAIVLERLTTEIKTMRYELRSIGAVDSRVKTE